VKTKKPLFLTPSFALAAFASSELDHAVNASMSSTSMRSAWWFGWSGLWKIVTEGAYATTAAPILRVILP